MMAWIRAFGGFALQGSLILLGAISILVFARDGFQVFLHDTFNVLIVVWERILDFIFGQPAIQQAIERLLAGLGSWLAGLGIKVDFVLQPHWNHAFVLLSLAFSAYAHAFKDFVSRPATSIFQYANAFVSSFLGGIMAGTVHLAHPGVLLWPLAALMLFLGLNSLCRCVFSERGLRSRILELRTAALWFGVVGLIAAFVLTRPITSGLRDLGPSPGLLFIAIAVAWLGVWATVFGFGATPDVRTETAERKALRWFDNPGRRMGLRVLATLGFAAVVSSLGQLAWGIMREVGADDTGGRGANFRDCRDCPEMKVIPAGEFTMGTTEAQKEQLQAAGLWREDDDDELPTREIAVPAFALAHTEATIAEFQAFIDATGYRPSGVCWGHDKNGNMGYHVRLNWHHPRFQQEPDHPVVCVTWWDAQAYARWLSLKTGETYRLPSEAEWEFAARAGTQTHYFWGDDADAGCDYMNGADATMKRRAPDWQTVNCEDDALYTAPVAQYEPNAFGLSDMTGNVWEWVEDRYCAYDPLRTDSEAVVCGNYARVLRGGSWGTAPWYLRSANRNSDLPSERDNSVGFRVARTLSPRNPDLYTASRARGRRGMGAQPS